MSLGERHVTDRSMKIGGWGMSEPRTIDFAGKVVHVYVKVGALSSTEVVQIALLSPRFEEQAGRVCLVGNSAGDESNSPWHSKARVCILWEFVSGYLLFDSLELYRAALTSLIPQPDPGGSEKTQRRTFFGRDLLRASEEVQ
jgi:hypothetical protein